MQHELQAMLSYRRPHGSKAEQKFVRRFIDPLGCRKDGFGNRLLSIGEAPRVMWSCHVDTVHKDGGRQVVHVKGDTAKLPTHSQSNCLGADDTAGVWLMMEMIKAGKEGLYVFHRGEECGGLGSSYIADNHQEILSGIDCAIALDRRGYMSVITHMGWRTCSDEFAGALGDALGLGQSPDNSGLFTDTETYAGDIPECTNLSVGYFDAHSAKETLDLAFLRDMRDALIRLEVSALPIRRDPQHDNDDWRDAAKKSSPVMGRGATFDPTIERLVRDYPGPVADLLDAYGITPDEILEHIYNTTGEAAWSRDAA